MARVIPSITRSDLGGDWSFHLRYSDIEPFFVNAAVDHLYLNVHFSKWVTHPDTPREERPASHEYPLLRVEFKPERDRYVSPGEPWYHDPEAPLVSVRIYAVPLVVAREVGLHRKDLRTELAAQLRTIEGARSLTDRWGVRAVLDANSHTIRWRLRTWNGLREADVQEVKTTLESTRA